ncbi:MAG: hypothetical protein LBQ54_12435 [Planctomycetaceae bacterium]|jgi:hypothetical protein|nr:hypothetical protein [Planctomycetaceae bacterium]
MMKFSKTLLSFLTFAALAQTAFGANFPEVEDALKKVLAGRSKMTSGHFLLTVRKGVQEEYSAGPEYSMEIYFQGDKIRSEKTQGVKHIFAFLNCYAPETIMHYNPKPFYPLNFSGKDPQPYISIGESDYRYIFDKVTEQIVGTRDYFVPDPRGLGVTAGNSVEMNAMHSFDSAFQFKKENGNLPAQGLAAYEDDKGERLLKISWEYHRYLNENHEIVNTPTDRFNVSKRNIWVDPDKDYVVRHIENSYKMTTQTFTISSLSTLHNEVVQDEKTGIWYPSKWVYESYDGDKLREHEECTLKAVSINEPIDEKIFTLESLKDLEPGTFVHWKCKSDPPGTIPLIWNGKITNMEIPLCY